MGRTTQLIASLIGALLIALVVPVQASAQCAGNPIDASQDQLATVGHVVAAARTTVEDEGWSWSRFGKGLLEGAVTGLVVGAAAAVIAATAPAVAAGLAVAAVGVAAYGVVQTVRHWDDMSGGDKSELAGNILGGLIGGGIGARAVNGILGTTMRTAGETAGVTDDAVNTVDDALNTADDAVGGAANTNLGLRAPSRRHTLSSITQKSVAKERNSVFDPSVDVAADVRAINAGKATRVGDDFVISGRTYGQHDGTLYPKSGPGIYPLSRPQFKALGVYNKFGRTARAEEILDKMGISAADREAAARVWATAQIS